VNATNRALNRAVILLVGIVLIAVGAAVAVAAAVPEWLEAWSDGSARVTDALGAAIASASLGFSDHSWVLVAGAVLAVIAAVLVAVFVLRQGRGHTRTVLRRSGDDGEIAVDSEVVHSSIERALREHPGVASVSVSSYRVRRAQNAAVKIDIGVRRGVSPADIREAADAVVADWDALLGETLPVLVTVNAGLATRLAKPTSLQTAATPHPNK
jgi:uncharacterized membrane protein YoaK (UPF0700 family)